MNLNKYARIVSCIAAGGLLLIGLFLLSSETPWTARAAPGDLFVTPSGGGDCSQASPCNLEMALSTAGDGDVLYLAAGTYAGSGGAVVTITHNSALYGGWDGSTVSPPVRDPTIHPTTIDGEGARRGVVVDSGITVTLEGFTITNGVDGLQGAGLYARYAHLTLRGMIFYSNVISTTLVDQAYGGGAMVEGGALLVEGSVFRANSAKAPSSSSGGGLAISGSLQAIVEGSRFEDNDAWEANGLYFFGDYSTVPSFIVRDCLFQDNGWGNSPGNASGGYSSAIQIVTADARVEDNVFVHNHAANGEGTVSVLYGRLDMARNVVRANESLYDVSGVRLWDVAAFTLTNNMIVENVSTYWWRQQQSVGIERSTGKMLHNTIARNANTYGIKVSGNASVTLLNTILVSHTVGITVEVGSAASLEGTLWGSDDWANGDDWAGGGDILTGTVNIWGNPAFKAPDSDSYHINLGSAARDAGVDVGVYADIDGDARPAGNGYDIGADEYGDAVHLLYLPLVMNGY